MIFHSYVSLPEGSFKRACTHSSSCHWAASAQRWLADSAAISPHLLLLLPRMGRHLDQHVSFYVAIQHHPPTWVYPILSTQRNLKDLLWSTGWSPQLSCRPQLELRRRSWPPRRPPQTPPPQLYVKNPGKRLLVTPKQLGFAGVHFTHIWK